MRNTDADQIAVIVPVYNVGAYLEDCLRSLCGQTHGNLQIILVDDGATDGSGEVCDRFAGADHRIHVIHKENQGAAAARNTGLDWVRDNCAAAYIGFADSDDVLHPRMYEWLLKAIRETGSDIAMCDALETTELTDTFFAEPQWHIEEESDGVSGMVKYWDRTALWDRLYRAEIWDELRLPEGRICEDKAIFVPLHYGRKEVRVHAELYYYRQRENSVVHSKYSVKNLDWFWAQELCIRQLEERSFEGRDRLLELDVKKYCRYLEIHYYRVLRELQLPAEAAVLKSKLKATMKKYKKKLDFSGDEFIECYRLLYPVATVWYCRWRSLLKGRTKR